MNVLHLKPVEEKLLLKSARTNAPAIEIPDDFDWDYFLETARRHAVLPLAAKNLLAAGILPPELRKKTNQEFQFNAARNSLLAARLGEIIKQLAAENISLLPIKGAALAVQAYGNLNLRRFVDLDVLCRKADAPRSLEILRAQDFELSPPLNRSQIRFVLKNQYNLPLFRRADRTNVELHWHIVPPGFLRGFAADVFWEEFAEIELNALKIKTLSPENHLLILCVHGAKHFWNRLSLAADVAELLRSHPRLNWETIDRRADREPLKSILHAGLLIADALLDAPVPPEIAQRAAVDARAARFARFVCENVFRHGGFGTNSWRESVGLNLALRAKWRDKAAYLAGLAAPTDGDFADAAFPAGFEFLYYGLRPFRLLTKFARLPHHKVF